MIKYLFILLLLLRASALRAQELYVFTEPASLMPAKSITAKLGSRFPNSWYNDQHRQRFIPEVMVGVSKKIMFHVSSTFSDYYSSAVRYESTKLYGQWRFLAHDDVHRHFRMALFAEGARTRSPFLYEELNLDGDQSGVQAGLIATQLVGKFALSATAGGTRVFAGSSHIMRDGHATAALNYSLSAGFLLFPRNYTSYRQLNLNLYVEMLGMRALQQPHNMVDLAPAVQVIVNSSYKFNVGYRFEVAGNMERVGRKTWYLGVEKTFLGLLQKK